MAAGQTSHQHFIKALQTEDDLAYPAMGPASTRPARVKKIDKRSEEFKNLLQRPRQGAALTLPGLASRLEAASVAGQCKATAPVADQSARQPDLGGPSQHRCTALVEIQRIRGQCKLSSQHATRLCWMHEKSLPLGRISLRKCMARTAGGRQCH
eukprot:11910101-Karenia_brevis.AAC.1